MLLGTGERIRFHDRIDPETGAVQHADRFSSPADVLAIQPVAFYDRYAWETAEERDRVAAIQPFTPPKTGTEG